MDETENPETLSSPAEVETAAEGKPTRRERGPSASRAGVFGRLGQFVRDVRAELKRVSWPGAKEVKNTTIITLVAVIFFAAYLFAVDQALGSLINGLSKLINKV